ncbi:MAG: hypothetical protein Q4A43_02345 [Coriobacteriia bacterium]|nr:hypothetical protein [Coriobacteriia bacterium]
MARKQKKGYGLGDKEKRSLHIVEFSKGKPNELSLNVLDNLASDTGEKRGFLSRLFGGKASGAHPSKQVIGSDVGAPKVSATSSATGDTGRVLGLAGSDAAKTKVSDDALAPAGAKRMHSSGALSGSRHQKTQEKKVLKKSKEKAKQERLVKAELAALNQAPLMGSDLLDEVKRRQKARRRYRIVSICVVVALCLAGIGAGGYYLYQQYLEQLEGIDLLKTSVGDIDGADNTIVAIDNYFSRPFDDSSLSEANHLLDDIPSAQTRLDSANEKATRAVEGLDLGSDDRQAAEHAVSSIALRKQLLDVADDRLLDDVAAKTAYDDMEEAWTAVQEANALMVQAASLVADTTNDNVNQASEYMKQAKLRFKDAKKSLKQGFKAYPSAKESKEYDYLDLRIKSIAYALKSNEAILIQDKKTAEKNNDKYNKLDKKAAKLSKNFSDGFTSVIVEAYAVNQKELQSKYESIRSDMGTHDSYLRDYLGKDSWV